MNTRSIVLALIATFVSASSFATPFFETGDAGENMSDALSVGAGVDHIYGSTTTSGADLYSFYWMGGALELDTFGSATDTQLFLFNAVGQGVWANDQASGSEPDSMIVDSSLAAGHYFIGISLFDYDPYSVDELMFPSAPFDGLFGPTCLSPLDHWARSSPHAVLGGSYVINFNTPTGVPEPPTIFLVGVMLLLILVRSGRSRI